MSIARQEQSAALQITPVEQDVATLTAWAPLVDVFVNPNGQANALGSVWTLYSVANGVRAPFASGTLKQVAQPERVIAQAQGSGNTIVLSVRSPAGVTSAVNLVTGVVVGYDSQFQESPNENFASATQPVDATNPIFGTLATFFPQADVTVNGNAQAQALNSVWTLYAVLAAGFDCPIAVGVLKDPNVEQVVIQGVLSGAAQYRIRGRSVFGATPGNVSASVIGYAAAGATGTVVLAGDVVGPSNANTLQSVTGGNGAAGRVQMNAGAYFSWAPTHATDPANGDLRWGDIVHNARILLAGGNGAGGEADVVNTDGFGNIFLGSAGWTVVQIGSGSISVASMNCSAGGLISSGTQNAILSFVFPAFKTQSVTGLFAFDSLDASLTGWKWGINGVEQAQITTSKFNSEKGQRDAVTLITDASYSVLQTDYCIALASTPTANRTFTLPSLAASTAGDEYEISAGALAGFTLSVAPSGTDKINGANAAAVIAGDYASIVVRMISASEGWRFV